MSGRTGWHNLNLAYERDTARQSRLPAIEARSVTEVHPGIGQFDDVKRVVVFLDNMPALSDEERYTILMNALDTGVVSIPIDKVHALRFP